MSSGGDLPTELDDIVEEFVARERAGEQPTISEFLRKFPDYESGIREIFPLLSVLENAGSEADRDDLPRRLQGVDPGVEELGDYRLLREIGRGGMGVVYEAEQKTLGRRVALKVLPSQTMRDPRFVERFRIEAQAAARLQHPHIVPVIGLSQDRGLHYYTMQYIDGHGLDEILEQSRALVRGDGAQTDSDSTSAARLFVGPLADTSSLGGTSPATDGLSRSVLRLPVTRAERGRYHENVARIGLQAAQALAYAHAQGVLHRDVKPSNILLDEGGVAWITDFGLCREEGSDAVTQTGDLIGTVRYMAPECFRGESDVRSDVYGLGITLYELLALEPAFSGRNRAALIKSVTLDRPARLRSQDALIPEDLATIVEKAIAPDREVRYQTAEELVSDLDAYLAGRPIAARAPTLAYLVLAAIRRNRALAATVAAALLLLLLSSVFYVRSIIEKERQARREMYAANIGAAESAVRDGDSNLAREYLEAAPDQYRAWEWRHLKSRVQQHIREFPSLSPQVAHRITHSPDGRWLAVGGKDSIRIYDDRTLKEVGRVAAPSALAIAWGADSSRLLFGTSGPGDTAVGGVPMYGRLHTWDWRGDGERSSRDLPDTPNAITVARDGAHVYIGSDDMRVWKLDAKTLQDVASVQLESRVAALAMSPDGKSVAAGMHGARVVLVDTADLSIQWRAPTSSRSVEFVTFAGDDYVAGSSHQGDVRVLRRADGVLHRVLPHARATRAVAGSPSGDLLVVSDKRSTHIHGWDPRSGRRLFAPRSHGRTVSSISFHPDGMRYVTASWAGTVKEWDASSERDPDVFVGHLSDASCVAIGPAGRLAVSGGCGGVLRVWDLDTGESVRALHGHRRWVSCAAFSPDGRFLVTGDMGPEPEIHVRRVSDWRLVHRLTGHRSRVRRLRFLPGSHTLLSVSDDGRLMRWNVDAGRSLGEMKLSEAPVLSLAVSPDGSVVAAAGMEKTIVLIDTATWTPVDQLEGHGRRVCGLAFHPSKPILASVSADQTIRVWDTDAGRLLRIISEEDEGHSQHTEVIQDVTFHGSGTRLFTADRSRAVKVWDWACGRRVATLNGHRSWVFVVDCHEDRVVSVSSDGTVRLWDTRTAAERAPALIAARRRRDLARPLVARLLSQSGDLDLVERQLIANPSLHAGELESALRLVAARKGSRAEIKKRLWRSVTPTTIEPRTLGSAEVLSQALDRASVHQGIADGEATLLIGIVRYRANPKADPYWLKTSIQENARRPELQAIAMAFIAMTCAHTASEASEAATWQDRLQVLLAARPESDSARVETFIEELERVRASK